MNTTTSEGKLTYISNTTYSFEIQLNSSVSHKRNDMSKKD